jgi:hypothetical protein
MKKLITIISLVAVAYIVFGISTARKPDGWSKVQHYMTRTEVYRLLGKPRSEPSAVTPAQTMAEWKQFTWFGGRALTLSFDSSDRVIGISNEAATWPFNLFI